MYRQIITFYQVCDAYLQQRGFQDDPQVKMTTTEVIVTALVAAFFFANNLRLACALMRESGLVVSMLSEGHFNRRWHKISQRTGRRSSTFWRQSSLQRPTRYS